MNENSLSCFLTFIYQSTFSFSLTFSKKKLRTVIIHNPERNKKRKVKYYLFKYFHVLFTGTYQGQWLRGMRHGYGVRTSAAFGIASHSKGGDGRRPSMSSLQPGVEEPKPSSSMSNGGGVGAGAKDNVEIRGGFVLKSRSDEAPTRRRSLVEKTGMKNLMQVIIILNKKCFTD